MAKEVELKYLLRPGQVQPLHRWPVLAGARERTAKRLVSTYYDTSDLALRARGVAFRLRQSGEAWRQTVKGETALQDGLAVREELETDLAGPHPDFTALEETPFAAVFADESLRRRLAPIFTTDFVRTAWRLPLDGGGEAEMALDEGVVRSGERSQPILEVELELVRGRVAALEALGRSLLDFLPLIPGDQSKAARGYQLAQGDPPPV